MKMKLVWLAIIFCATATHTATGIQIDNQLISSKNDCFERIVLEAMIPFDRTFRTTDTNKKQICEKLCIAEGDKCQTYSLGISVKGNGTCQLSSNKIDLSTGRRPTGTLYDPDFDIYQRKENCGVYDTASNPPLPGGLGPNIQIASTFPPNRPNNDRPTTPNFSTSNHQIPDGSSSTTPDESVPPTGTQNQNGSERPLYSGYGETTNQHPSTPSSRYPPEDIYPSTERYPNKDRYPTESTYGTPNTYPTNDKYGKPTYAVHPHEDTYSTSLPTHSSETYNSPSYPTTNHDHFNFHHDIYPTYSYPMLYENNYPQPNDYGRYPNIYAQNIPTILTDYYGPGENYYQHVKPDPPNRPIDQNDDNFYLPDHSYNPRPTQSNRDRPMHYGSDRDRIGQTHFEYEQNRTNPMGYGDRDRTPNGHSNRPMNKPNEYMDRDKPLTGGYESIPNSLYKPSSTQNYGYGNNDKAEGNYHVAKEPIETYFNPDDYLPKRKPGDVTGTGGNHGSMGPGARPIEDNRPCFRRALAGKRVSQRWVRRTLMCERVEDCQAECGHEKRFTCEGFNYKLDPSGRGQGICELMDVPLTKMDLYSNGPNRDENLIFHPDYDYYERDRNACRPSNCRDCVEKPSEPVGSDYFRPTTYRPDSNYKPFLPDHHSSPPSNIDSVGYGSPSDRYNPPITAIDKYRPPIYDNRPPKEYDSRPPSYDSRPPTYHSRPHPYEGSRPSIYENRPPDYDRYDVESGPFSSPGGSFRPSLYGGGDVDRYDFKPIEVSRPGYQEVIIPANHDYGPPKDSQPHPYRDHHNRPDFIPFESYRPERRPTASGVDYQVPYRPDFAQSYRPFDIDRDRPPPSRPDRFPPSGYLDREPISGHRKPGSYLPIGAENPWGSYGGTYGGSSYSKYSSDYWGLRNEIKRNDGHHFNYFELGGSKHGPYLPSENAIWNYPGSKYNNADRHSYRDKINYDGLATLWTRRPGQDECSAKSSEGFRLHKGVIRHSFTVPSVIECERMCYSEDSYRCTTYSFRYSPASRDNCQLCDRPVNQLDYYADIEPDRDFDIYSMTDDPIMCSKPRVPERSNNAQCFFRAIDSSRFFKSIVRDSLNVRSVGECEMECIKSSKFTCRAFSFRYGAKSPDGVIDNCQLSDWPVRDMDKERHLILDAAFDVFERASYGRGCEIQPIIDEKHKKLCYLGYGSPSKLLSTAIKKVISAPTELECKNECIRFRETTPFKCFSFSFTSQQSTFNCEMSDLDQSELKLNVHYVHVSDRDFWLFAWNPFDYSCRDKVNTIGGSRVNNDRRMDIFREPGQNTWTHYTVSGKACRSRSGCQQNAVTGFYSCEIDGIERDAWDYCCNVDHPCGYSQGFDYPWCFVGDRPDQWRTCSDRYFPSASESTDRPTKVAVTYAPSNKKKGEAYHQAPPKPGGLNLEDVASARLWPVTYLYSSGPPNTTELSNFVDCNKESC